jgi:hypothetical protein
MLNVLCARDRERSVCVCILALVILHANRTVCASHYIVICGLSGSPHPSSALSRKRHDVPKSVIEHKMFFDFLYNFIWKISYSQKNPARYYHKSTCKVAVTLFFEVCHPRCVSNESNVRCVQYDVKHNFYNGWYNSLLNNNYSTTCFGHAIWP